MIVLHSQALSQYPRPQAGGSPGRITKQTMQTFHGVPSRAGWEIATGKMWSREAEVIRQRERGPNTRRQVSPHYRLQSDSLSPPPQIRLLAGGQGQG